MTDFLTLPDFVTVVEIAKVFVGGGCTGGGVDVAGDSFLGLIDFKASSNGLKFDGCAMLASGSFLTGTGAFLKLGSLGFGLGAEKKDESDFAFLTSTAGFVSFFTGTGVLDNGTDVVDVVVFLAGGAALEGASALRFLPLESAMIVNPGTSCSNGLT